jgi:hypothetical protein
MKTPDLSGSQNLIQIPDLARCPNIEEVILSHCRMLGQVYSSSFLCELKCLWLNGCISLRSLHIPSSILQRTSGLIVVYGCSSLEMFSVGNEKMRVQCSTPYYSMELMQRSLFRRVPALLQKQHPSDEKFSITFEPLDCVERRVTFITKLRSVERRVTFITSKS